MPASRWRVALLALCAGEVVELGVDTIAPCVAVEGDPSIAVEIRAPPPGGAARSPVLARSHVTLAAAGLGACVVRAPADWFSCSGRGAWKADPPSSFGGGAGSIGL